MNSSTKCDNAPTPKQCVSRGSSRLVNKRVMIDPLTSIDHNGLSQRLQDAGAIIVCAVDSTIDYFISSRDPSSPGEQNRRKRSRMSAPYTASSSRHRALSKATASVPSQIGVLQDSLVRVLQLGVRVLSIAEINHKLRSSQQNHSSASFKRALKFEFPPHSLAITDLGLVYYPIIKSYHHSSGNRKPTSQTVSSLRKPRPIASTKYCFCESCNLYFADPDRHWESKEHISSVNKNKYIFDLLDVLFSSYDINNSSLGSVSSSPYTIPNSPLTLSVLRTLFPDKLVESVVTHD